MRNTQQFVSGFPANNVLLTGARSTGKSSLIKTLLTEFAGVRLHLVEVDKKDLVAFPDSSGTTKYSSRILHYFL